MTKMALILILSVVVAGTAFILYFFSDDYCCATCTGSKICNACKNCNYCKHCAKNGGVCGVCSPESYEVKKPLVNKDTVKKSSKAIPKSK